MDDCLLLLLVEFSLSLFDEDPLLSVQTLQEVTHQLRLDVEAICHLLLCRNFHGGKLDDPYPVCCTQLVESPSLVVGMRRVRLHGEVVGLILPVRDATNKRWFDHGLCDQWLLVLALLSHVVDVTTNLAPDATCELSKLEELLPTECVPYKVQLVLRVFERLWIKHKDARLTSSILPNELEILVVLHVLLNVKDGDPLVHGHLDVLDTCPGHRRVIHAFRL